jgi:hypothetical protein
MKTFNFYVDTKVTAWYRTNFEIEANSEEEAKKKSIEFVMNDDHSGISWEHIDETIETMSVGDNDGQSTEELYDTHGNMIWDNTENSTLSTIDTLLNK